MRLIVFVSLIITVVATATTSYTPSDTPSSIPSTLEEMVPILAQFNIDIDRLNTTAPHFVKLIDTIDHYTSNYLKRDLETIRPSLEFLSNVWLPSEAKYIYSKLDLFTGLSPEVNYIRTLVLEYINSATLQFDIALISYKLDRYAELEVPLLVHHYHRLFTDYYDMLASQEFKTLYTNFVWYVNHHLDEEVRLLQSYMEYAKYTNRRTAAF